MNDLGDRELRYKLKDEDSDRIVFEQHNNYSDGVDFINSLYTETFMIKEFSDTKKLISGTKAILTNGEEVLFSNRTGVNDSLWFKYDDCHSTIIPYIALKGATVTQQKGN